MKYFHATIPSNADHPAGRFVTETYLAAESKVQAKQKASVYLFELDGRNCMFYKSPRLEEVSEDTYRAKVMTDGVGEPLPDADAFQHHAEIDQYLACLVLFGEQETYDESELRDAEEFLASPDDEPEKFAEFSVLCERLADVTLAPDAPLEAVHAACLALYNARWPSEAALATLPPVSVDNPVGNGVEAGAGSEPGGDAPTLVNNSSIGDDRSPENVAGARTWADIELDIVLAGLEAVTGPDDVTPDTETWARKKVDRRTGEMTAWALGLRALPDALSYGRDFIFDLVRALPAGLDIERDAAALDAHIAGFVQQFGALYIRAAGAQAIIAEPTADGADSEKMAAQVISAEVSVPAILGAFPPVSGQVASGAGVTVGALNTQLDALPPGRSLVLVGLPNAWYHAAEGYSSTQLRLVQTSGTSALDWYRAAPRDEDTAALSIGSAVHTALLEPERFAVEYACAPVVNLRTNAGKEELAAFEERCSQAGITPMKAEEHRKVCLIRDSARAQPVVAALLQHGVAELSVFYRTERGTLFKIRPDWFGELSGVPFVLDVKTTDDVHDFGKSVEAYGYHVQAAFYSWVMHMVFGIEVDFAFSALSKSRECSRYPVALGLLDDEDFDEGMKQAQDLVAQIEQGEHDGFTVDMGTFHRPWWAKRADRQRRESTAFGGEA